MFGEVGPKQNSNYLYGGMFIINQINVNVNASSITFSNIPQIFNHLRILITGRNTAGAVANYQLKVNNISTGYDDAYYQANSSNISAGSEVNNSHWASAVMPTNGTSSGGQIVMEFPFYTNTNLNKCYYAYGGETNQTAITSYIGAYCGSIRSTIPISNINIFSASGNISASSIFYLYGIY